MRLQEEQRRRDELLEYSEDLSFERMSGPAGALACCSLCKLALARPGGVCLFEKLPPCIMPASHLPAPRVSLLFDRALLACMPHDPGAVTPQDADT